MCLSCPCVTINKDKSVVIYLVRMYTLNDLLNQLTTSDIENTFSIHYWIKHMIKCINFFVQWSLYFDLLLIQVSNTYSFSFLLLRLIWRSELYKYLNLLWEGYFKFFRIVDFMFLNNRLAWGWWHLRLNSLSGCFWYGEWHFVL